MKKLKELDVTNKRVLVRVDYNVALDQGRVAEPKRILATLPTLKYLLERKAKVILISHLGRPKGKPEPKYSLKPVHEMLEELCGKGEIPASSCYFWDRDLRTQDLKVQVQTMDGGEMILLENLRFDPGEEKNDSIFAASLATLADVFVQEAFGAVHRAHASTNAVAKLLPCAMGFLVEKELEMLGRITENPARPFVVLLGGVKVSDKIGAIENLLKRGADKILIGGAMSYTFLAAQGVSTGSSLLQADWLERCRELLSLYPGRIVAAPDHWALPVSPSLPKAGDANSPKLFSGLGIDDGWTGYDIGPQSIELFKKEIAQAKTIFWNGPQGLMEVKPFDKGSAELASAIAQATRNGCLSVLGGGDTIYAVRLAGLKEEDFTHVSTGGGATLEFLEGKTLPGMVLN